MRGFRVFCLWCRVCDGGFRVCGLLLAAGYQDGPLSFLAPETIRDLMVDGVAVQQGFIGDEVSSSCLLRAFLPSPFVSLPYI